VRYWSPDPCGECGDPDCTDGPVRDVTAEVEAMRAALQGLYDFLPRYSCKADAPDGCPVCVARAALKG
jgi:hypothetical protein